MVLDPAPGPKPLGQGPLLGAVLLDMDLQSEIGCLPTCCGPDNPPRHEPVRFADYVLPRLDRNYAYRHRPAA